MQPLALIKIHILSVYQILLPPWLAPLQDTPNRKEWFFQHFWGAKRIVFSKIMEDHNDYFLLAEEGKENIRSTQD